MELLARYKDWHLLEVDCAAVGIELVDLWLLSAHFHVVTLRQVERRDWDRLNKLFSFFSGKLSLSEFDLVHSHGIVPLHKPWLLLVLFHESLWVLISVLLLVLIVSKRQLLQIRLSGLDAGKLLERDEWLAHSGNEYAIFVEVAVRLLALPQAARASSTWYGLPA